MQKKTGIVCAMYHEAQPIIQHFNLKQVSAPSNLQFFENQDMALIVSGVGKIASAVGTTFLLCNRHCYRCLNIGICGSCNEEYKIGDLCLIDQIIDLEGQREYFPDVLHTLEFPRANLQTVHSPAKKVNDIQADLVDMEASGFYDAASNFLDAGDIFVLKVVSDFLDMSEVSKDDIKNHIQSNVEHFELIHDLPIESAEHVFMEDEVLFINGLYDNYFFTVTQKFQLLDGLRKLKIQTGKHIPEMFDFEGIIKSSSNAKMRGKRLLQEIEKALQEI